MAIHLLIVFLLLSTRRGRTFRSEHAATHLERAVLRAARFDNRVPRVRFRTYGRPGRMPVRRHGAGAGEWVPPPLRLHCNRGSLGRRGRIMTILASRIDTATPEFRAGATRMRALVAELEQRRTEAAAGGPERARERHLARGKLLPRDRVMALIDGGTPFLELSPLAANGMYD